jgi:hypothetical protein
VVCAASGAVAESAVMRRPAMDIVRIETVMTFLLNLWTSTSIVTLQMR